MKALWQRSRGQGARRSCILQSFGLRHSVFALLAVALCATATAQRVTPPPPSTADELAAGTETQARSLSPALVKTELDRRIGTGTAAKVVVSSSLPTVNDDITDYVVGTRWHYTAGTVDDADDRLFVLGDSTDGAAGWIEWPALPSLTGVNSITSATGQPLTLATPDSNANVVIDPHGTGRVKSYAQLDVLQDGTSTALVDEYFGGSPQMALFQANTDNTYGAVFHSFGSGGYGAYNYFLSSKSTDGATHAALTNGRYIAYLQFLGDNGSDYEDGAYIWVYVDGTPSTNLPTSMDFATSPGASTSAQARLRIHAAGHLSVLSTTSSTTKDTGALVVTDGGVGVEGAINAGGAIAGASLKADVTNGTAVDLIASASVTLDFAEIAATASADLTITVTGAATGDVVQLGLPANPTSGIVFQGFISAANTVTVRATNITGSPVDPASASYRVAVTSF